MQTKSKYFFKLRKIILCSPDVAETSLINLEEVKKRLERDIEAKAEHIDQLETKLLAAQSEIEKQGEQLNQSLKQNERLEKQILDLRKIQILNLR